MKALPAKSFKPSLTRSRRSVECRRLTARACGSDLNSASPLPAWRQTMFECINSCSTAPERTGIDAHRWRSLRPHDKQRRAGPRVAVFQAESVWTPTHTSLPSSFKGAPTRSFLGHIASITTRSWAVTRQ